MEARKLAIVGGGVTKDKAPFDDESVIIWSTASVGLHLPRVDAMFEFHDGVFSDEELSAKNCYVWMRNKRLGVPLSERFPIEKLEEAYGKRFNGTISMMLAFATLVDFHFTDIDLYGCDFSNEEEYGRRVMFMYLLGLFRGMGFNIKICPGGYLQDECSTYMYDDDGLDYLRKSEESAREELAHVTSEIARGEQIRFKLAGRIEALAEIKRRF